MKIEDRENFLAWIEGSRAELNTLGYEITISEGFEREIFEGGYVDFDLGDKFMAQISIDPTYGDFFELWDWQAGDRVFDDHVVDVTEEVFGVWKSKLLNPPPVPQKIPKTNKIMDFFNKALGQRNASTT